MCIISININITIASSKKKSVNKHLKKWNGFLIISIIEIFTYNLNLH